MTIPAYLRRRQGASGSAHGAKSERRLAKALNARLNPGSGALQGAKGDMVLPDFLLEAKSTVNRSMSLQHEWLAKIAREALAASKAPALSVSFVTSDGKPVPSGDWVLVPRRVFEEIAGKINEGE